MTTYFIQKTHIRKINSQHLLQYSITHLKRKDRLNIENVVSEFCFNLNAIR